MQIDTSELTQLAADLDAVTANAGPYINLAVQITARKVRDDARETVRANRDVRFAHAASSIDYEMKNLDAFGVSVLDAEIGYNRDRPSGKLGNLIEYGAPGAPNMLAPSSDLQKALEANQEDFERGLDRALRDAEAFLRGDRNILSSARVVLRGTFH